MRVLPLLVAMMVLTSQSQAAILPFTTCTLCATIFRQFGCLDTESVMCKFIAIKFTTQFQPSNDKLCDNFICEGGYGQNANGHRCSPVIGCLFTKWRAQGICPTGTICCAP